MYISVHYDKKKNTVFALEQINGREIHQEYPAEYFFYTEDKNGKHKSIDDKFACRHVFTDYQSFSNAYRMYQNKKVPTFEAKVRPLFKTLEKHYKKISKVNLRKCYFDIETDFDAGDNTRDGRGYAPPDDPFNRVTAITFYNNWEGILYSLSLPPKHISLDEAEKMLAHFPNNLVCESEEQMFELFFELTKDAHVYAGWNSSIFDVPYLVNRTKRILGLEATKNFCLWGYKPQARTIENYGKEVQIYDLVGKVHLDMMELYRKYTYTEQPSYSLDYISSIELGENKVAYDGSLDKLYNEDYVKFIDYARQDTNLLYRLDQKKDHINLAFTIAHENRVDLKTVMGTVALSDNAITLEAHRRGMITPDYHNDGDTKIPGAWVADPQVGITNWVGSVDLTSLYPSIFRAFNLGNETIIGQIKLDMTMPIIEEKLSKETTDELGNVIKKKEEKFAAAWKEFFNVLEFDEILNKTDKELTLILEDGSEHKMKASEIYDFVFNNDFTITPYCTIIRNDKQSVVASLLERWFNERKQFQNRSETYQKLTAGIELPKHILEKL